MGCCLSRQQPGADDGSDDLSGPIATIRSARRSKRTRCLIPPPPPSQIRPPIQPGRAGRPGVSRAFLERERIAFFETRIQGDLASWKAIQDVCTFLQRSARTPDDMEEARSRLANAGLMCPSGQMWDENKDIGDRERNRVDRRQRRRRREAGGSTAEPAVPDPSNPSAEPPELEMVETGAGEDPAVPNEAGGAASGLAASRSRGKHMPGMWDERGNHYYVPLWCMADPVDIVEDDSMSIAETVARDYVEKGAAGAASNPAHHSILSSDSMNEKKSPLDDATELSIGEPPAEVETTVEIRARLSDPPQDLIVSFNPKRSAAQFISVVRKEANIPEDANIRLIHAGQLMKRTFSLLDQGWAPGAIIQVFVSRAN